MSSFCPPKLGAHNYAYTKLLFLRLYFLTQLFPSPPSLKMLFMHLLYLYMHFLKLSFLQSSGKMGFTNNNVSKRPWASVSPSVKEGLGWMTNHGLQFASSGMQRRMNCSAEHSWELMQGLYMNEVFQPRCYTKLLRTHPHDDEERSLEPEQIVCGGTETGKPSPFIKVLVLCCLACPTSMTEIVHSQGTPDWWVQSWSGNLA